MSAENVRNRVPHLKERKGEICLVTVVGTIDRLYYSVGGTLGLIAYAIVTPALVARVLHLYMKNYCAKTHASEINELVA